MLDLKKLMLLPIVCCVLVQQTDAEVVLDKETTEELKNTKLSTDKARISWFSKKILELQTKGAQKNLEYYRSVAPMILNATSEMGGIALSIIKGKLPELYQAAKTKTSNDAVPNNDPNNNGKLFGAISDSMHTERQLIQTILQHHEVELHGELHIYTYLPPCAVKNYTNRDFTCCSYYAAIAHRFPNIKFHIYFDKLQFGNFNVTYDTATKVFELYKILSSNNEYHKSMKSYFRDQGMQQKYKVAFNNIEQNILPALDTEEDCETLASHIRAALFSYSNVHNNSVLQIDQKQKIPAFYNTIISESAQSQNIPTPRNITFHIIETKLHSETNINTSTFH